MLIVYAPSGKRMLPYPPVAPFLLAASVSRASGREPRVIDLEIVLERMQHRGEDCLLYRRSLSPGEALEEPLAADVAGYAELLASLVDLGSDDALAISVMGVEQLASALLLARVALGLGCRVIMGGQFWTMDSVGPALTALVKWGSASITVGDGWDAIVAFQSRPNEVPPNSYRLVDGVVEAGPRTGTSLPPQPDYAAADWDSYARYGARVYRRPEIVRRCHLYIWDKICNFRCAFCRVASGSKARLTPPGDAIESLLILNERRVTQLNFMTNELNPSRQYMLRFLDELERPDVGNVSWLSYVRADYLEPSDLVRLHAAGCRLARYGVESGSQRLLDLMRKDYQVETMENTLRYAADAGIWNHVNLLVGFPGETDRDAELSCEFVRRNAASLHSVRINPFYLPPGTPIARNPEQFGIELTNFNQGWWEYRALDGSVPDAEAVVTRIRRISDACLAEGIGFAGNDPFLLLDALATYSDRDRAHSYLRSEFGFLWEALPPAMYQARIGGYSLQADWTDVTLKRGRNYSLAFCTD